MCLNGNILVLLLCYLLKSHLTFCEEINAKLVPQVSESKCNYDADCLESNSYCKGNDAAAKKSGLCACREDHFIQNQGKNYKCYAFVNGLESECIVDEQCVIAVGNNFVYCDKNNGCQCNDSHHPHGNRCYKTVEINGTCQTDYECAVNTNTNNYGSGDSSNTYAHCVTGRCQCGLNQHYLRTKNRCVDSVAIGANCQSDDNCTPEDVAICRVKCVCRPGYVVSNQGIECLKAADDVGHPCQQLSQCTEFLGAESECDPRTSTCMCKEGAHQAGGGTRCHQRRNLGDTCTHRGQCIANDATGQSKSDCVAGVCECIGGSWQRGRYCVSGDGARAGDDNGARVATTGSAHIALAVVLFIVLC